MSTIRTCDALVCVLGLNNGLVSVISSLYKNYSIALVFLKKQDFWRQRQISLDCMICLVLLAVYFSEH